MKYIIGSILTLSLLFNVIFIAETKEYTITIKSLDEAPITIKYKYIYPPEVVFPDSTDYNGRYVDLVLTSADSANFWDYSYTVK